MLWQKYKYILASQIIIGTNLLGATQQTIDGKQPIFVSFSTSSHNRIAVEDGAVEKIFGDSSIFSVTIDSITGNAFVNVLEEIGDTPAALSVVTSTGLVQDLLVSAKEGPSEPILLRENEAPPFFRQDVSMAFTVDVLNKILEGKIPFGYGQTDADIPLVLPAPLEAEPVKAFVGPFEIITVYRITNRGAETIVLFADALKASESWAFLNQREIDPGESVLCLIGHPKDEGGS